MFEEPQMSNSLLGGLLVIDRDNIRTDEVQHAHDHADDHGPAVVVGPLSLFQTDGPGEELHGGGLSLPLDDIV
jgi:hypothetical protein